MSLIIDIESCGTLREAIEQLSEDRPEIGFKGRGTPVRFSRHLEDGLCLTRDANGVTISYGRPSDALRGIGVLLGGEEWGEKFHQVSQFTTVGAMLDLSRNGVMKVVAIKQLVRMISLMGYNTLFLYMEDVYEVDNEPLFGNSRGAYSKEELREIDQYCLLFGIVAIPCVQTLGHMEQIFQWPQYSSINDTANVMLVGEERTYQLIGNMLDTLATCFSTRRIHIGMDEAHGLARGVYLDKHGYVRSSDVFTEHLERVNGLCKQRGLQPMIWSDMYFRMGSATHDYYDLDAHIRPEAREAIPSDVQLVYWDYYHTDPDFYRTYIDRHRQLGKEPLFAAGAWTWGRFWTHHPRAFATISASLAAAKEKSLKEVFLTHWGDDGTECLPGSLLPALQYFAELTYSDSVSEQQLANRFFGTCSKSWSVYSSLSGIDAVPGDKTPYENVANFSKWILWHDPILNFLDMDIPDSMEDHFAELSLKFAEFEGTDLEVRFIKELTATLRAKCQIHSKIRYLYQSRDVDGLQELRSGPLGLVQTGVANLNELHRRIWHDYFKPFGWEILERRYAGLLARLKHLDDLLSRLPESFPRIAEFEGPGKAVYANTKKNDLYLIYARTASSTVRN